MLRIHTQKSTRMLRLKKTPNKQVENKNKPPTPENHTPNTPHPTKKVVLFCLILAWLNFKVNVLNHFTVDCSLVETLPCRYFYLQFF